MHPNARAVVPLLPEGVVTEWVQISQHVLDKLQIQ